MDNQDIKKAIETSPEKSEKTYEEAFSELRSFIMKTRAEEANKEDSTSK